MRPEAPITTTTSPRGVIRRYLVDPHHANHEMLHRVTSIAKQIMPIVGVCAVIVVVTLVVAVLARRHRQHHIERDASYVEVAAPPEVAGAGASVLWTNLHDILRPSWPRFLWGQPHLSFEISWSVAGISVGLWVPKTVPLSMVTQAVESAWHGARTIVHSPAPAPLAVDDLAVGGELRLQAPECSLCPDGSRGTVTAFHYKPLTARY